MRKLFSFTLIFLSLCSYAQTLVLPGDYPDPSVVKISESYWATATTSNWMPAYPLLESKDLVNWKTRGYVFNELPDWADYYFWAPEISYDNGKVFIYYSAHKKDGNLCLGIASADRPEGPYTDYGPMMCQEVGSIDAFPVRDENGKLFLVWKEDGNSVGKPTPIWAQELSEDRRSLLGEKHELFRNDKEWEANLVEGVSMIRHGEYIYTFYAGAGCCGRGCTYNVGVARSKSLLGPWEKYPKNPLVPVKDDWKCPGHGTPIEKDGKFYFLYHAYNNESNVYAGRQGLLSEFKFTDDNWIQFIYESKPKDVTVEKVEDEFSGDSLSLNWQWSVFKDNISADVSNGKLVLKAMPAKSGAYVGQKTYDEDYNAETVISVGESDAEAGLALVGDDQNLICLSYKNNVLKLWRIQGDKETIISEKNIDIKDKIHLKVEFKGEKEIAFSYSTNGKKFTKIKAESVDGSYLPPWDRAVRVALVSKGEENQKAVFESFKLKND